MGGGGEGEMDAVRLERNEDGRVIALFAITMTNENRNGPQHYWPVSDASTGTMLRKNPTLSERLPLHSTRHDTFNEAPYSGRHRDWRFYCGGLQ